MKRRRTAIRLLLILVLATQLTVFTPTTNARGFTTSKCTGTLTLTAGALTIVKAISFLVLGSPTTFSVSYTAVIQGITYSATASGTCVPN